MRENKGGSGLAGAAACWFSGLQSGSWWPGDCFRGRRSRRLVPLLALIASLRSCPDGRWRLFYIEAIDVRSCPDTAGVCFTSMPLTMPLTMPYVDDGSCDLVLRSLQLASLLLLAVVLHRRRRWGMFYIDAIDGIFLPSQTIILINY